MFLSGLVSVIEASLVTIEAFNVIAMRTQVIAKGDARAVRETEFMVSDKFEAFARAGLDIAAGLSNAMIRDNYRAAIQANGMRLATLRPAA